MNSVFSQRLETRYDELKWLYCELYHNDRNSFGYFCKMLERSFEARKESLRQLDEKRLADPGWFRSNRLLGMMLYVNAFAGNLKGVQKKLPYLEECGVNYLHLMPLLASPKGRSDGGYAVADFRTVQPELGSMEDLEALADLCREKGMSLCLDFVMNHTSEDHEWAKAARAGDPVARRRYYFYDSWDEPNVYEQTVPQVFPTTAPGNFTWLDDCNQVVMTTFYPYQWDLNYANPMVFNDMTENMLFLANRGINVIRLDAVPYIWKEPGTSCRNLPQVHTLVRLMRLACEIVCPSVLLLGEVVMEPTKVVPYFGTEASPECHMLYNVTTMASTWHTVATGDVRLLRRQLDLISRLPTDCLFQNYLRCHDDIGWGFDEDAQREMGIDPQMHKEYVYRFYEGAFPGSWSMGELYNFDPATRDARTCGTAASLCGVERAIAEKDKAGLDLAIRRMLLMHGVMLFQKGLPMFNSGDEIAQLNGWDYRKNEALREDSRNLHRTRFSDENAALRLKSGTLQQKVFSGIAALESMRTSAAFSTDAYVSTWDTGNCGVLALVRFSSDETLIGIFNFTGMPADVTLRALDGEYRDTASGKVQELSRIRVQAFEMKLLVRTLQAD